MMSAALPYNIETVPGCGRVLVAARDLAPWELVLEDTCLAVIPCDTPVCLACLGELTPDEVVTCPGCSWPLCSEDCATRVGGDHSRECRLLAETGVTPGINSYTETNWLYTAISLLRVLFLKQDDPEKWKEVEQLMDHWEERSKDESTVAALKIIFAFFNKKLSLDWVSLEEVFHVFGVLQTNSISLVSVAGRGCYPRVSLLSHSCVPNLEPASNPSHQITLRAKRHIKAGEQLTIRYAHFMQPTWRIQTVLRGEWMFDCACVRCAESERSDMGTFTSYFQCKCEGFFNKRINASDIFECHKCSIQRDFSTKLRELATIEDIINRSNNPDQIEKICSQLENDELIHEQYYLKTIAFIKFGELFQDTQVLELLIKVESRTKTALNLIRDLDPGSSKVTGKLLIILAETKEKILAAEKKTLGPKEIKLAVAEIVKTKYIANKMLSKNCVRK